MSEKKKNYTKVFLIFLGLGILLISLYNLYSMYSKIEIKNSKYESQKLQSTTNSMDNIYNNEAKESSIEDLLENTIQSVVGISRLTSAGGSILNNVSSDDLGLGTGIIVSENGYILSNNHVTGDRFSICYVTIDENKYKGMVVFSEPDLDLSIVKIDANNLKPIMLGDSRDIKIGAQVYAIGNPIGYEFRRTVTSGIISAINRTIKIGEEDDVSYISDLIQTDATINPGNSRWTTSKY